MDYPLKRPAYSDNAQAPVLTPPRTSPAGGMTKLSHLLFFLSHPSRKIIDFNIHNQYLFS
jgi:hypothetical protein